MTELTEIQKLRIRLQQAKEAEQQKQMAYCNEQMAKAQAAQEAAQRAIEDRITQECIAYDLAEYFNENNR